MLKRMINYEGRLFYLLQKELSEKYNIKVTENTKTNIQNIFTNEFVTGSAKNTYKNCQFVKEKDGDFMVADQFYNELKDEKFKEILNEIIEFGIYRYNKDYGKLYKDTTFNLYAKYTYDDVCRLLDWEKGEVALNIGGYKYDSKTKTYPVFINYHKDESIQDTVKYEDRFIDNSTIIAISKSGRSLASNDVKLALDSEKNGVRMELFVRKNKEDKNTSKEFYYLGKIKPTGDVYEMLMPNTNKKAVEIVYKLETPVRDELFEYLVK